MRVRLPGQYRNTYTVLLLYGGSEPHHEYDLVPARYILIPKKGLVRCRYRNFPLFGSARPCKLTILPWSEPNRISAKYLLLLVRQTLGFNLQGAFTVRSRVFSGSKNSHGSV